jgi:diguanylate cyclase (GGDEF)-like protein
LADVDRFKSYNDQFGHPAGDEVLKTVATLLQETARRSDFVGRYGGEEFAVALPDTNVRGATALAERFRRAIAEFDWPDRNVTASFGVSTVSLGPSKGRDDTGVGAMLIIEADRALYQSKRNGCNCVTHARELAEV